MGPSGGLRRDPVISCAEFHIHFTRSIRLLSPAESLGPSPCGPSSRAASRRDVGVPVGSRTICGVRPCAILMRVGHSRTRGHADDRAQNPSVFQRYNIVSDGDLREAARKLDARVG